MLTDKTIKAILTGNAKATEWLDALNKYLPAYQINTKERQAMFFAQTCHESANYKTLTENLNYSAAGLLKTFPKYFNSVDAAAYQRKPEKIANRVYGNRMGNGSEGSGDGYRFRGRGIIMCTGKTNYTLFAKTIGKTLEEVVPYMETIEGSVHFACYYWKSRNINAAADNKNITLATKLINGGTIGLKDRTENYNRISALL